MVSHSVRHTRGQAPAALYTRDVLIVRDLEADMARLLLLTAQPGAPASVLGALEFLEHRVSVAAPTVDAVLRHPDTELILLDARRDLAAARSLCRALHTADAQTPILAVFTEGGLAALSSPWGMTDLVLDSAGPAELAARLRLALSRTVELQESSTARGPIRSSGVVIDEDSYTAKVHGEPMNLTYKEFELLKHLTQHPGRVFTREQLLHEVWGYDYFGGTRTVDVHVRRLRSKLGADREQLIGTVRNVGYRFVPRDHHDDQSPPAPDGDESAR